MQTSKTNFEILKEIDLKLLVSRGLISIFTYQKFLIYEHFINSLKKMSKKDAIIDVLEVNKISLKTFYNAINEMGRK